MSSRAILQSGVLSMLALAAPVSAQSEGDRAELIHARDWFYWIGEEPRLESFEGRAVLLHFFVCEEPKKSNWLGVMRAQREFGDKGLQILAITPDDSTTVAALLEEFPLPFPVGAGSPMNSKWGMGEYGQVLIDAKGDVFYRAGASNAVWDGKIGKVIRNTERLGARAHLRLTPQGEQPKKFKKAIDLLRGGELAKADAALEKIADSSKEEERVAAASLRDELKVHVERVMGGVRRELERGKVLFAREVLEELVKDLKKHDLGEAARALLTELEADAKHAEEVEAAETLAGIVDAFFRRGWEKNVDRWERLMEEHPTTHAAKVTRLFWLPRPW
ncbi:MAG: redoxin domain-containing protein [Planctomycetes bacterium]|nr:redoxin domain-containing protein [Planctomycetota bacterium]